jgi:hypothetical protein
MLKNIGTVRRAAKIHDSNLFVGKALQSEEGAMLLRHHPGLLFFDYPPP